MPSIFLATPSYGPPVTAHNEMLLNTIPALERAGFVVRQKTLEGCCYVHTARNKLARDFLFSGLDDLLFIDADVAAKPEEIVRLAQRDRPIVGGAAPFRHGPDGGFPLHAVLGADGRPQFDGDGLVLVDPLPTAVMKIKRQVLIDIGKAGKAPLRIEYHRSDAVPPEERERYLSFFDFEVDEVRHIEFGEDVTFCRKWQALGGSLWVDPDMTIRHYGVDCRTGNFKDYLAQQKEPAQCLMPPRLPRKRPKSRRLPKSW